MNKKNMVLILVLIIIILVITIYFIFYNKVSSGKMEESNQIEKLESYDKESNNEENKEDNNMKVIIKDKEYKIILENNETVKSLMELLPLELSMNELNGNEKYYYLDEILPTNSTNPGRIEKGDIMLYGNNCLVIFYKSFNTSYSYTKIGHIDNLPDLGSGNIKITFSN